jgi:transaldolase
MNRTRQLSALGQSLWLDNISRALLEDGTLARYIEERSITGLTSNPTIFDKAIGQTSAYDRGIRDKTRAGHVDALAAKLQRDGDRAFVKSLYLLPFDHRHSYKTGMFERAQP